MDYWKECISEAFDDAGVTVTSKQLETVASWVEGAHENYGLATGHDCIPNPMKLENDRLQVKLEKERNKDTCPICEGKGDITMHGPVHSATSQCWKCRGEGRC